MNYQEIKQLMEDMGNSKLEALEIDFPDGTKISMKKNQKKEKVVHTQKEEHPNKKQEVIVEDRNVVQEVSYKEIKSPMVGTFYASASPDKDAFVKVGDKISKGQVLCIVEAMKLMNEIESEFDGEIVEVCVQNEEIVEYGQVMFKVK